MLVTDIIAQFNTNNWVSVPNSLSVEQCSLHCFNESYSTNQLYKYKRRQYRINSENLLQMRDRNTSSNHTIHFRINKNPKPNNVIDKRLDFFPVSCSFSVRLEISPFCVDHHDSKNLINSIKLNIYVSVRSFVFFMHARFALAYCFHYSSFHLLAPLMVIVSFRIVANICSIRIFSERTSFQMNTINKPIKMYMHSDNVIDPRLNERKNGIK